MDPRPVLIVLGAANFFFVAVLLWFGGAALQSVDRRVYYAGLSSDRKLAMDGRSRARSHKQSWAGRTGAGHEARQDSLCAEPIEAAVRRKTIIFEGVRRARRCPDPMP